MSVPETAPFTSEQRRALLDEFFPLYERRITVDTLVARVRGGFSEGMSDAEKTALWDEFRTSDARLQELVEIYKHQVPIIALSRCPFCQAINYHSFDFYDLDGLWWNGSSDWRKTVQSNVYRPRERHRLCPHFWSLSGAVALQGAPSPSPLIVNPGPEVPFIFAHTLNFPAIKVVISQFSVGSHTAYPIVYFSEVKPVPWELVRPQFNEWCNTIGLTFNKDGNPSPDQRGIEYPMASNSSSPFSQAADDFDLAPWIKRGRILWIAPGDESLTLKQQVEGCPYLDLPGHRDRVKVVKGQVRPALFPRKI